MTPLIEVRSHELSNVFDNVERVRVAIRQGRIVITAHHQDVKVAEREKRLIEKLRRGEELAVGSLFHGSGVIDRAMHSGLLRSGVGSFVQVGVEIEPVYLDCSLRNSPMLWRDDSVAICSDIRRGELGQQCAPGRAAAGRFALHRRLPQRTQQKQAVVRRGACRRRFAVRLLPRCGQGAESGSGCAGERAGVPGQCFDGGHPLVLSSLGYQLSEAVLDGNEFGALERRRRLAMVAVSRGLDTVFDFSSLKPVRQKEATLKELLEDLPLDSERWKPYDYLAREGKARQGRRQGVCAPAADG